MKYKINDAQMRFVLWLQIVSLFILWGFILLPITIFYYLGWKEQNLDENTKFVAFLFNKYQQEDS
jgi:hypothetical protein